MIVQSARVYVVPSGNRRPVIVELRTDDGSAGIGEAGLAYGLGGTAAAAMIKEMCERAVLGRDAFRIEEIWNDIYDHSFWAKGGGPVTFAALSAIEQALWDIKGGRHCPQVSTAGPAPARAAAPSAAKDCTDSSCS